MKAPILLALAVALAACGGDGGTNVSSGPPAALSIIAGADQVDTVLATLATPITVEVKDAADVPVSGTVVNFVVTTADCGAPFAGSAATDASGLASDLWVLGTKAGPCTMEVRAVTAAGEPQVLGSLEATILPGAAVSVNASQGSAWVGEKIAIADLAEFEDAHGNLLTAPDVTLVGNVAGIERAADSIWSAIERQETIGYQVGDYASQLDASRIAWFQDLGLSSWQVAFSCSGNSEVGGSPNGDPPDSIAVEMALDSVVYSVTPGIDRSNSAGTVYFSGIHTRVTGPDEVEVPLDDHEQFFIQRAGLIEWGTGRGLATSSEGVPSSYTGGDWCVFGVVGWSGWQTASLVIFSKLP
ncbi:MAG: hypothetical protein V3T08_09635 [Gemmatimonadota bacterium]